MYSQSRQSIRPASLVNDVFVYISVTCTITCLDLIVILNVSLSIFDWIYRLMVVVAMVTTFVFIISM